MKKTIVTLVALLAICGTSFAQDFGWGVKVGMNVSDMSKLSGSDAKTGLTAGVFADYRFNDWFAVSGDLLFSREGAKFKDDGDKVTIKSNYLNIPILANFYVLDDLAFKIGIQPGFMLSGKAKTKTGGQEYSQSITDNFHTVDFAFPVGVSYELFDKIILDARSNIGVANVLKVADDSNSNVHNNYFTISVGYRF